MFGTVTGVGPKAAALTEQFLHKHTWNPSCPGKAVRAASLREPLIKVTILPAPGDQNINFT